MTETTTACIRGCSLYRQHLTDCEDPDACRGCLPRRANHGLLCWPCHRRYELMLTDAPTVYRWLTGNLAAGQGAATEDEHVTATKELPLPIKAAVFDVRQLLADRLVVTVDHVAELLNVKPPTRVRLVMGLGKVEKLPMDTGDCVAADARFMLTWLPSIERFDLIGDWFEELADTMIDAHALAPWRPAVRRVGSIPCPECAEVNLRIYGGETDVTCGSCGMMIPEDRFGLWERIVKAEAGIEVAG